MILRFLFVLFVSTESLAFSQQTETSQLPELVIIGDINATPATWFRTDSNLYHLATNSAIHFHVMRPDSKLYRDRYEALISGPTPLLLMQKAGGGVVYAASAQTMPTSPAKLYAELKEAWNFAEQAVPVADTPLLEQASEDCPDGFCPNQPEPTVRPKLLPLQREPALPTAENWFTDSISTGAIAICVVVVVILMILFGLVILAFLFLLNQFLPRR